MVKIGALTDHLTGASTLGIQLAKSGARTAVFFNEDITDEIKTAAEYDAVIVKLGAGPFGREQLYNRTAAVAKTLKNLGAQLFCKQIGAAPRDEIGFEIEAMLDQLGSDAVAVVVPPVPQPKRVADEENAVFYDAIAAGTKRGVGHIDFKNLPEGSEALQNALSHCRENGNTIIVADAAAQNDIEKLAEAVSKLKWNVLAVDEGEFTAKLACLKGWISHRPATKAGAKIVQENGTALVVAGSFSRVTQEQVELLLSRSDVDHVAVNDALLTSDENAGNEIDRVVENAVNMIHSQNPPRTVVVETVLCGKATDSAAENNKTGFSGGARVNRMNDALGRITAGIIAKVPEQVIGICVIGGGTMEAVRSRLGAKAVELIDNVIPQTNVGRLIGAGPRLPVIWKRGAAGSEHTAEDIVNRLFAESSKEQFSQI